MRISEIAVSVSGRGLEVVAALVEVGVQQRGRVRGGDLAEVEPPDAEHRELEARLPQLFASAWSPPDVRFEPVRDADGDLLPPRLADNPMAVAGTPAARPSIRGRPRSGAPPTPG